MKFSYPKKEKLCSKILIERLFNEGKVIYEFPLKVLWMELELPEKVPVQSVISVSKRRFKRAVKRNILKRRMREAFRLNKHELHKTLEEGKLQIGIMILYNNNSLVEFSLIESGMKNVLSKIGDKISQKCQNNA
jgi:ribonuclease P protein component